MENLNSKLRPETRTKIKNETKMLKDKMRKDLREEKKIKMKFETLRQKKKL